MEHESLPDTDHQCAFISIYDPLPRQIYGKDVHLLNHVSKTILFSSLSQSNNLKISKGYMLLERLKRLSPSTADEFELKSEALAKLTMRLWNQRGHQNVSESSYLALSYCWKAATQRDAQASTVSIPPPDYPLPISPPLFQALLAERNSSQEGIWCDQVCIDQNNEKEKAMAIQAMDVVYQSAREVVIALDDIEINGDEQTFLQHYIHSHEHSLMLIENPIALNSSRSIMEFNPLFRQLFEKIVGARWFKRAWCAHEMRLGSKHVFLARCSIDDGSFCLTVLRFTGSFFSHLLALAVQVSSFKAPSTYDILPSLISIFGASAIAEYDSHKIRPPDQGIETQSFTPFAETYGEPTSLPGYVSQELAFELRSTVNRSYIRVFLEIFELEAGGDPRLGKELRQQDANQDKMSIICNTIANGLAFRRSHIGQTATLLATEDECCRKILLLSLANDDPNALCTTGRPLRLNSASHSWSWLCWPEMSDIQDNLPPLSSSKLSFDQSAKAEFISLDLLFLGQKHDRSRASSNYIRTVELLIDQYILSHDHEPHFPFWNYITGANASFKKRGIETLACLLECGKSWIVDVSRRCGYSDYAVLQDWIDLLPHVFFEAGYFEDEKWLNFEESYKATSAMLQFTYHLALVGVPWLKLDDAAWKPLIITTSVNDKLLIFSMVERENEPAVPNVLRDISYERLSRVWILGSRCGNQYELLGKSRIFGAHAIARNQSTTWQLRRRQLVYGP